MKNVETIKVTLREDDRGWVAWPIQGHLLNDRAVTNIHIPCLRPGSVRGNHYHLHASEYVLILSGPCKAVFIDNATEEIREVIISGERPELLKIAPDSAHAFKNISDHDICLVCYETPAREDNKKDIYRRHILS